MLSHLNCIDFRFDTHPGIFEKKKTERKKRFCIPVVIKPNKTQTHVTRKRKEERNDWCCCWLQPTKIYVQQQQIMHGLWIVWIQMIFYLCAFVVLFGGKDVISARMPRTRAKNRKPLVVYWQHICSRQPPNSGMNQDYFMYLQVVLL